MPKQVVSANAFIEATRRPDVKHIKIIRVNEETAKFKLKTAKKEFSLTVKKGHLIQSIIDSIPENVKYEIVEKKQIVDQFNAVEEEK